MLGILIVPGQAAPAEAQAPKAASHEKNSCINCHSDTRFLVQNKKLYEYFEGWKESVHALQNITCSDCHGGNPKAVSKKAAHAGAVMGSAERASPINYQNIPNTCARCHKAVFERFQESKHFQHLKAGKQEEQGPNCVTCHGSVNTTVLTVSTVRSTCEKCHNDQTRNYPNIPGEAEKVLNNFLSINRYYRFIALRSTPEDAKAFFQLVDPIVKKLNAEWHAFDLEAVDKSTQDLVQFLRLRRNELIQQGARSGGQGPSGGR